MEETYQVHVHITGDVTGVGYRAWAKREAEQLAITGWVRNVGDGHVEVVGQGEKQALQHFVSLCKSGPDVSWVQDVVMVWEEPLERWTDFRILS